MSAWKASGKLIAILLLLFVTDSEILAQQDAQMSLFGLHRFQYNPSEAGSNNALDVIGHFRAQWLGISGNPMTESFSASMPLYAINAGAGISLQSDQAGAGVLSSAYLAAAYSISIGAGDLRIGANAGIIQYSLDGSRLRASDGVYEPGGTVIHNDNYIPVNQSSNLQADFALGITYRLKSFTAGLSSSHLLEPKIKLNWSNQSTELQFNRHYFLDLAYETALGNNFILKPAILLKTDFVIWQTDFNIIAEYKNNIWGGLSFRGYNKNSVDALSVMTGMKIGEQLSIAYSYDIGLSALNLVQSGSHELLVHYQLAMSKPRGGKVIENPRFLYY